MYGYLFSNAMFSICLLMVKTEHEEYDSLVNTEVNVLLDNLTIHGGRNLSSPSDNCSFTLHRNKCANPSIESHETIAWNTWLCFQWSCDISEYVIRVESCFVGSKYNPIHLITAEGCSADTSMISSPRYDTDLQTASSLGRLTIRHVGFSYLRLKCRIQLCHICDEECPALTPPKNCTDYSDEYKQHRQAIFWNSNSLFGRFCSVSNSSVYKLAPLLKSALFVITLFCCYHLIFNEK